MTAAEWMILDLYRARKLHAETRKARASKRAEVGGCGDKPPCHFEPCKDRCKACEAVWLYHTEYRLRARKAAACLRALVLEGKRLEKEATK